MPILKPLPDCEGPKLEPFTQDITAHELEFLEVPLFESQLHSIIIKLKIDGRVYCLKLFYKAGVSGYLHHREFDRFDEDRARKESPALWQALFDHNDQFNCECRAFGRLKEIGREDIAVGCYGYVSLPLTKDILQNVEKVAHPDWGSEPLDLREISGPRGGPDDGSHCVLGILKDWVPFDEPRSDHERALEELRQHSMFPRMLRNGKALHRSGIVICDIHHAQWVNGILVDLSCAMTIPHVHGPGGTSKCPSWTFASAAAWDLYCFQIRIIDGWNHIEWSDWYPIVTPPRKCTIRAYGVTKAMLKEARSMRDRLRPRPKQYGPYLPILAHSPEPDLELIELPPYDPAMFDWRAAGATCGKGRGGEERGAVAKTSATTSSSGGGEKKTVEQRAARAHARKEKKMAKRRADAKTKA
ncbi:uncharacterized protein DNG_04098 [Cephalotrichum gorgonifer]|uniref:Uncharacterized protein n=1 Tax=Cephalotrichum gorgonifer TaxID=2041049 RepID=A0AAE8SU86_9PEZI|nr:uncharacterized protein DNG_04098 [Cephalotrichum gorgonifer]